MKVATVMNLELLRTLMIEFIAERETAGDLTRALTLSEFLIWLTNKENENGKTSRHTGRVSSVLQWSERGRARDC